MPNLFRFLTVTGTIFGIIAGTLFFFSVQFEPELKEETKVVPGIKIRKE